MFRDSVLDFDHNFFETLPPLAYTASATKNPGAGSLIEVTELFPGTDRRDRKRIQGDRSKNRNGSLYSRSPAQSSHDSKKASTTDDTMQLDDTKYKMYIYNLEDELAECDSPEEKLIFLPDIEKHMSKIPQSILRPPQQPISTNTDVVLYNVPTSLSIPKEQDSVRKAIIETRARARERQAQEIQDGVTLPPLSKVGSNLTFGDTTKPIMADGFGSKIRQSSTNNATSRNTFGLSAQNPLPTSYPAPQINGITNVNTPIFPPLTPSHFMNEYSAKPFINSYNTSKPIDIHQEVVVDDPDAMEIG
ncbi:hypothetical protein FGG08_004348 [Glutinoglossum americanum]|uniref:Uncharacterized protein n=1 Tax=Glutinoglossum americanum TaxID=1670608 RepID=A0A9P8IBL6_9PEZI|nr:hypothetical protein FGG08_004348 [Glutinoglossum americanum]